jgi:hypothetical protein
LSFSFAKLLFDYLLLGLLQKTRVNLKISHGIQYILLMINRTTIVNIHVAFMILYLPKNERIVIISRAKLATKAPIKNGLMSAKVKAFVE